MTGERQAGRYVALLRGINIGRAKRVSMAELRAVVEGLGYRDVRTLLNSGNVGFTAAGVSAAEAAARIEGAFQTRVGFSSRTFVLTAAELAAGLAENPLLEVATDPSRLYAGVLEDATAHARVQPLLARDWSPEQLALGARMVYLWCPPGVIQSELIPAVQRALGDAVTMRNWKTMVRLGALAAG